MKNKLYTYYGITLMVILFFSILLPLIITRADELFLLGTHELKKIDFSLDSEAKDIPLVQRIHDIYGEIYSSNKLEETNVWQINAAPEENKLILEQLQELVQKKVLVIEDENYVNKIESIYVKILYSSSVNNLKEYIINFANQKVSLWWDIENSKIIYINIKGNNLIKFNENKDVLLKGYLSYLNLDLLGDWNIENKFIQSKKASLVINFDSLNSDIEQNLYVIPKITSIQ